MMKRIISFIFISLFRETLLQVISSHSHAHSSSFASTGNGQQGFSKTTSFEGQNHAQTFKSVGKPTALQSNPSFAFQNPGIQNGQQIGHFNSDSVGGGFAHRFVSTGSTSETQQLMSQPDHLVNQGHHIVHAPQGQMVIHGQQVPSTFHTQKRHQIIHSENGPQTENTQPGNPLIQGQHGHSMFHVQQGHPVIHRIPESQSIHGDVGLKKVQQQEHQAIQGQTRINDPQGHQVVGRQQGHHTIEVHNVHTPLQNHQIHQTEGSHSFSTANVGGPISSPYVDSPSQILKTISTTNTGQIGENNADSLFMPQSFKNYPFPRNFILPERHRKQKSLQNDANNMLETEFQTEQQSATSHHFETTHNIHPPERIDNPQERNANSNPESSHTANNNPQSSQNNVPGFASFGNPPIRDGGFLHSGVESSSTFHAPVQFTNGFFQLDSSNRNNEMVTCTEEYKKFPNHTMCLVDNKSLNISGVSESQRLEILRMHNNFRGTVMPEASDIFTMRWDDRLAIVAQKWANQCSRFHDKMRVVPSLGKHTLIGQNLAGGFSNWSSVLKEWWNEHTIWQYGIDPNTYIPEISDVAETIGHFIQMTYNATYMVGCGYAECDGSRYERYYVCNYAPGLRSFTHPFTIGDRCRACPHTCRNGKCDCGGRVCNNGGTLNMDTCLCNCGSLYAGPSCDILSCPFNDNPECGVQYQKDHCVVLQKVNQDCPYLCGRCAAGHDFCGGRVCYNGGVLKENTCRCSCSPPYTGDTCQANCGVADDEFCSRWPDVFCHWDTHIQTRCPHRCDKCPQK